MQSKKCVICSENAEIGDGNGYIHVNCVRCGDFFITREVTQDYIRELKNESIITKISGWINENPKVKIDGIKFEWLLKNLITPNVYEKAQKLLKWLNQKTIYPGLSIPIKLNKSNEDYIKLLAICWAYNGKEIRYLIEYLVKKMFVSRGEDDNINISLIVTPDGFAYLENINVNPGSNLGFCAMWFDESMNDAWEKGFEPAIKRAGYNAKRIDKHPHNGVIVDEIIALIRQSKFIIADLTGNRGGVYFEAGFAKGLGIEVIFTCRNDISISNLHFDVRHYNFLQWELEKYEELISNLSLRIESTLGRGKY